MTASDSHHFDFGVRRKGPHCPLLWNKFINPHPPNTHSSLKVQAPIQSATSACESSILTDLSHPLPRSKRSSSLSESPLCKVLLFYTQIATMTHIKPSPLPQQLPAIFFPPQLTTHISLILTQGSQHYSYDKFPIREPLLTRVHPSREGPHSALCSTLLCPTKLQPFQELVTNYLREAKLSKPSLINSQTSRGGMEKTRPYVL